MDFVLSLSREEEWMGNGRRNAWIRAGVDWREDRGLI